MTVDALPPAAAALRQRELAEPEVFPCKGTADLAALMVASENLTAWRLRADAVRRGLRQALGLTPRLPRPPLGVRRRTVATEGNVKVQSFVMEVLPGLFGAGNLYSATTARGRQPVVLLPHGHDEAGRFNANQQRVAMGLAGMGCLAVTYDMQGFGEATQLDHDWFGMAALQTWQSMRMLDLALSLPSTDPRRVACSGYSGGGTQTILLTALDPRVTVSIPVVMVSAAFFGGCVCESGLPLHRQVVDGELVQTNNAEIAALASVGADGPRPLLLVSADGDWTALTPHREFPFIQRIYGLFGGNGSALVENAHLADVTHDYGPAKRQAAYDFVARHFELPPAGAETEGTILVAEDLKYGLADLLPGVPRAALELQVARFFGLGRG